MLGGVSIFTVGAFIRGGTHLSYTRAVPSLLCPVRDLTLFFTLFLHLLELLGALIFHILGGLPDGTLSYFTGPRSTCTLVVLSVAFPADVAAVVTTVRLVTFLVDVAVVVAPDRLLLSERAFRCFGGESALLFEGFDRKLYALGEGRASFLALACASNRDFPS